MEKSDNPGTPAGRQMHAFRRLCMPVLVGLGNILLFFQKSFIAKYRINKKPLKIVLKNDASVLVQVLG